MKWSLPQIEKKTGGSNSIPSFITAEKDVLLSTGKFSTTPSEVFFSQRVLRYYQTTMALTNYHKVYETCLLFLCLILLVQMVVNEV